MLSCSQVETEAMITNVNKPLNNGVRATAAAAAAAAASPATTIPPNNRATRTARVSTSTSASLSSSTTTTRAKRSSTSRRLERERERERKRKRRKKKQQQQQQPTQQWDNGKEKHGNDNDNGNGNDSTNSSSRSSSVLPSQSKRMTMAMMKDDSIARIKVDINIAMKEIASIGFFRAAPLNQFRQKLKECLKRNVLLPSTTDDGDGHGDGDGDGDGTSTFTSNNNNNKNNIFFQYKYKYDRLKIVRILTNDIDWNTLCKDHDRQQQQQQQQNHPITDSTTALFEIVVTMINPTVIPQCCRDKCLVEVFLNALLVSPSSSDTLLQQPAFTASASATTTTTTTTLRWSPSQKFLLETIRKLLAGIWKSSVAGLSDDSLLINYVRNLVPSTSSSSSTAAMAGVVVAVAVAEAPKSTLTTTTKAKMEISLPNRVNRLSSVIYWLLNSSSDSPERSLISFLCISGMSESPRTSSWSS